jgi:Fe-S cluster assembly protein SufD
MPKNIAAKPGKDQSSGAIEWLNNPAGGTMAVSSGNKSGEARRMIICYDRVSAASVPIRQVFQLNRPDTALELLIIFIGHKNANLNLDLKVEHLVPGTRANISFKAVLFDRSKVEFTGNLAVSSRAQKSDTFLKCDTLLLSSDAQSRVVPSLEIIADDVKAGHAASSGKPDQDTLFYLMSRGLDLNFARNLLVQSFLADSLKIFNFETVQQEEILKNKLLKLL